MVFLDTGYHFAETIGTRDWITGVLPITLVNVTPAADRRRAGRPPSAPQLHDRDPDLCCALRKVQPLAEALAGYVAWGSGVRRDESPTRAATRLVDWDAKRGMVKVNPMAAWTQDDVDAYIARHQVPVNPLFELGYGSIGCAPCTRPVAPGEDPRAGRWAGRGKTECGIHPDARSAAGWAHAPTAAPVPRRDRRRPARPAAWSGDGDGLRRTVELPELPGRRRRDRARSPTSPRRWTTTPTSTCAGARCT